MILNLLENTSCFNKFHFRLTGSPKITLNFDVDSVDKTKEYASAQTQRGINIICKNTYDNIWHNVNAFVATNQDIKLDLSVYLDIHESIDVIIYGPLYAGLTKLEVSGEDMEVIDYPCKFTVIGGKDTYGRNCTTAGFKYSNILSRKNNCFTQNFEYDNDNYLDDLKMDIKTCDEYPGIIFMELNSLYDNNKLLEVIETLEFNTLFLWYYNSTNTSLLEAIKKEYNPVIIDEDTKISPDNKVYLCDLSGFNTEYFNEFCSINGKSLNDSGNVYLYRIIQKFLKDVI